MSDSLFSGNSVSATTTTGSATAQGGGIHNGGLLTLRNTAVSDNTGTASGPGGVVQGAGIWNGTFGASRSRTVSSTKYVRRTKCRRLGLSAACLGTLVALVLVPQASATYPGHNGLIVFNAVTSGQNQLFTVRPNGHDLRQITHLDGDSLVADWSPDGRQIVFEFDPADGSGASVELMNADGSGLTNLTLSPVCCSGQPSFTRTGSGSSSSASTPTHSTTPSGA